MGIFEEDRSLKHGKNDWLKLLESRNSQGKKVLKESEDKKLDLSMRDKDYDEEGDPSTSAGVKVHADGATPVTNEDPEELAESDDSVVNKFFDEFEKWKKTSPEDSEIFLHDKYFTDKVMPDSKMSSIDHDILKGDILKGEVSAVLSTAKDKYTQYPKEVTRDMAIYTSPDGTINDVDEGTDGHGDDTGTDRRSDLEFDEAVSTGGVAVVPHRMGISESDVDRLDERTKNKIEKLQSRYEKMQEDMAALEEEMNHLREMGQKQYTLDEMKMQVSDLKEEIDELKKGPKPAKKDEEEFHDVEDVESEVEPSEPEEIVNEKDKEPKKKVKKKEEVKESYIPNIHGKVPGKGKSLDMVDVKAKKKRMVEGAYQKYLKQNKNRKNGETPDEFTCVLG